MPKPKGAGDLRQRVKFQRRPIEGSDGYGNHEGPWADLGVERSCSAQPTKGGEDVRAGRVAGTATWDIWLRSDSGTRDLKTGDRAIDTRDPTRTFNIVFGPHDMDGRREWLLIQATTGAGPDG